MSAHAIPGAIFSTPATLVEDADEEIMELYMNLEALSSSHDGTGTGGLGYLDPHKNEMEIYLQFEPPADVRKRKKVKSISVDVVVHQDPGALRTRIGDTGSVLWRSSLHLATYLLQQHYFPTSPLLKLSDLRILELGAGTGILAALLGPLCKQYTASDRAENIKLVAKNVDANKGAVKGDPATVVPIDWVEVGAERRRALSKGEKYRLPQDVDIVLAVDCIYNESLAQPLVDTLAAACANGALAWVVVELRSSDTITTFLDTWLNDSAGWTIVRLGPDAMGDWGGAGARWVGWVGWCA